MAKIVYLFGAGASANALPTIDQIPDRIKKMIDYLPELEAKENALNPCGEEAMNELQEQLRWLNNVIGKHATMDTLAKKLWIQRNFSKEYYDLKFAMAAYFILEQINRNPDARYDTFWASLVDGLTKQLPNNISILSWNYDSQFELSYNNYFPSNSITAIQNILGVKENEFEANGNFLLKLNGSALLLHKQDTINHNYKSIDPFWGRGKKSIVDYIYYFYVHKQKPENIHIELSFAWETINHRGVLPRIESRVKGAEILVVIGYSFPYFNRSIDRKIIESMPNLKKIYFQDSNPGKITNVFKAISNKKFDTEKIAYTDQFFLPPEL